MLMHRELVTLAQASYKSLGLAASSQLQHALSALTNNVVANHDCGRLTCSRVVLTACCSWESDLASLAVRLSTCTTAAMKQIVANAGLCNDVWETCHN